MDDTQLPGTIVFLHGSGDSAGVWDGVIARLGNYQCLALDLPGHGALANVPGPEHMSVADYAAAVRDELDRRGLASVALIGHSLGSAIALRLAVDTPAMVSRLGLVGAGARLRVLPALLASARDGSAADPRLSELEVAPGHEALAAGWKQRRPPNAPGMLYRDLAACDAFDMMSELERVGQPTLVLAGEADRLTPPKYATYLRDHISGARLVLIPRAGHYLMLEVPDATAEALRRWISDA
jgi:pimeloyl-ACP methyl ester carboxylesterase